MQRLFNEMFMNYAAILMKFIKFESFRVFLSGEGWDKFQISSAKLT